MSPRLPSLWPLILKECRETLRDRRTLFTLILMPLLTYPLIGSVMTKFLASQSRPAKVAPYRVICENEILVQQVAELLKQGREAIERDQRDNADSMQRENTSADSPKDGHPSVEISSSLGLPATDTPNASVSGTPMFQLLTPNVDGSSLHAQELLDSDAVDLVILPDEERGFAVHYAPALAESRGAFAAFSQRMEQADLERARELLHHARMFDGEFKPVSVKLPDRPGTSPLAPLIPMMLVLMTVTGAVYPAIDLTAGERERGTMEALLAAPVSPRRLLAAKYVAVVLVAMLTGIVNLVAMFITVSSTGLTKTLLGDETLTFATMSTLGGMLAIFSLMFSAVLLAVTTSARSFKEAQAYLIPLMMLSLAPAIISLMPQVSANLIFSIVPILNLVLLTRDLFLHQVLPHLALLTLVTSGIYTVISLRLAAAAFASDVATPPLLRGWRSFSSPSGRREVPSAGLGGWSLLIVASLFVVLSGFGGTMKGISLELRLTINALVTIALFFAFPLLVVRLMRFSATRTFAWKTPPIGSLVGAILAGASLWVVLLQLELFLIPRDRQEQLVQLFGHVQKAVVDLPFPLILACLAVVPAVCEETFFRGWLFAAFSTRMRPIAVIAFTGVAFGLFHIIGGDGLVPERVIPTTILGLVLGTVRYWSGSLWPSMLLHVLNNGLVLFLGKYHDAVAQSGWIPQDEYARWPILYTITASCMATAGLGVIYSNSNGKSREAAGGSP